MSITNIVIALMVVSTNYVPIGDGIYKREVTTNLTYSSSIPELDVIKYECYECGEVYKLGPEIFFGKRPTQLYFGIENTECVCDLCKAIKKKRAEKRNKDKYPIVREDENRGRNPFWEIKARGN